MIDRLGAGHSGECNVDSHLERTHFHESTKVFTDVHLRISPTQTFQIDTLIVSTRYVLIIEVKNISGTVRFIPNPPHLQRTLGNGAEMVIDCLVYQLEANKANLDHWFRQHGFNTKSSGLLVLANPNTTVQDAPSDFPMIYKKQLPFHLQRFKPDETIFSVAELHKIGQLIQRERQKFNPFPLCSNYRINPNELRTGLLCRHCKRELHRKNRETWHCIQCKRNVSKPYEEAIRDWVMLVKSSITNAECRRFLRLKDRNAAHYILSKLPLVKKGKSVGTFYTASHQFFTNL